MPPIVGHGITESFELFDCATTQSSLRSLGEVLGGFCSQNNSCARGKLLRQQKLSWCLGHFYFAAIATIAICSRRRHPKK